MKRVKEKLGFTPHRFFKLIFVLLGGLSGPPAFGLESGYWYYCNDNKMYYPDTLTCPSPWEKVAPETLPPPTSQDNSVPTPLPNDNTNNPYPKPVPSQNSTDTCTANLEIGEPPSIKQAKLDTLQKCEDAKKAKATAARDQDTREQIYLSRGMAGCGNVVIEPGDSDAMKQQKYDKQRTCEQTEQRRHTVTFTVEEGCTGGDDLRAEVWKEECKSAQLGWKLQRDKTQAEKENASIAAKIQPHASPQLLAYEDRLGRLAHIFATADVASMCRLRSPQWFESLSLGVDRAQIELIPMRNGLTKDEQTTASVYWNRTVTDVFTEYPVSKDPIGACRKMAQSGDLQNDDELQIKLINNYH